MLITTFGCRPSQSRAGLYWMLFFCCSSKLEFLLSLSYTLHAHHCHDFHSHPWYCAEPEKKKRKNRSWRLRLCTGVWYEWDVRIKESCYSLKFIGGWLFFFHWCTDFTGISYFPYFFGFEWPSHVSAGLWIALFHSLGAFFWRWTCFWLQFHPKYWLIQKRASVAFQSSWSTLISKNNWCEKYRIALCCFHFKTDLFNGLSMSMHIAHNRWLHIPFHSIG